VPTSGSPLARVLSTKDRGGGSGCPQVGCRWQACGRGDLASSGPPPTAGPPLTASRGGWGPSCHPAPPCPGPLLRAGELVGHPNRARVPRGGAHGECRRCVPSLGARFGAFLSGGGARSRTSTRPPPTSRTPANQRWAAPSRPSVTRLRRLSFFVTDWPLRKAVYQAWYQARYTRLPVVSASKT
jgi:hypothetical protein